MNNIGMTENSLLVYTKIADNPGLTSRQLFDCLSKSTDKNWSVGYVNYILEGLINVSFIKEEDHCYYLTDKYC